MNIQAEIKKEGIDVIKQLEPSTVNSIAKSIVKVLQNAFPEKNLDIKTLTSEISKLNMYVANLPEGCSAKYFYKNKSIYFSPTTSITKINDLIVHECIHYLQERTNKKGKIDRMGFCDFTDSYLPGTGMNEAAVQLLASKCMKKKSEAVSYFGLNFNTVSPNYYPLECALVNQLNYIIGNNVLFDSTFNSNDNFEDQFISLTSAKDYDKILDNLDLLVDKQDFINELTAFNNSHSNNSKKVAHNLKKIEKTKSEIKDLFFETQNLIITSYFDSYVNLIYSKEALEKYRTKLYNFRNYIATADGYTFYNRYYINKMVELENKLENGFTPSATALILYKDNLFKSLVKNIKTLFKLSNKDVSTVTNNK